MKLFSLIAGMLTLSVFATAQGPAATATNTAVPSAQDILDKAYAQAKAENKNVILMFHASWCGWCHKMDNSINDESCKQFFADNYVTVHITVEENETHKADENPGGKELKAKYHGDKAGLPFWLILDKDGKLIGDSYMRKAGVSLDEPGENIGCPAADNEVAAFIDLLKKSSKITDKEIEAVTVRFKKNNAH